jgi:hypothetical protein
MQEENTKLNKLFESLNKNLYRTNKILELYTPLCEIFSSLSNDLEELNKTIKNLPYLNSQVEQEIKKRELISLYKRMEGVVCNIKDEINYFYDKIEKGDNIFEEFRGHRTYVFENANKSKLFLKKISDVFNIDQFILKFSVVGTVDLNDIAKHIKGKKYGIDIIVPRENIDLIYEEILKSKTTKFRLVYESLAIYFEKDNVLRIEGASKKIKLCDINAKEFDAKLLDN